MEKSFSISETFFLKNISASLKYLYYRKEKKYIHLKLSIKCGHWTYLFWNKDQYQAENVISDEEKKIIWNID